MANEFSVGDRVRLKSMPDKVGTVLDVSTMDGNVAVEMETPGAGVEVSYFPGKKVWWLTAEQWEKITPPPLFGVGDVVRVVNSGYVYSCYRDFIEAHRRDLLPEWRFNSSPVKGSFARVIHSALHMRDEVHVYIIKAMGNGGVYIMGEDGLEGARHSISISMEGEKIVAALAVNGETVKEAEAEYTPGDLFGLDFIEGAGWAFERLTGLRVAHRNDEAAPKKESARALKPGDWVYINDPGSAWHGRVGRVSDVRGSLIGIEHRAVWSDRGDGWERTTTQGSDCKLMLLEGYDGRYENYPGRGRETPLNAWVCCFGGCDIGFTRGRKYEFRDGAICDDDGMQRYTCGRPYTSVEEWNKRNGWAALFDEVDDFSTENG